MSMTSTSQSMPPSPAAQRLPSLSNLMNGPPPMRSEHLPHYSHTKIPYHQLPSCAQLAGQQLPAASAAAQHHLSPRPPPPITGTPPASALSPPSIQPLLHACTAASHEMLQGTHAGARTVKAEPTEDARVDLSRRSSAADSLYGTGSEGRGSSTSTLLCSSGSYGPSDAAWGVSSLSPSAGVGSTSSASGNLIKGEEGHLQQDEQQRCKMAVKSTSPDSVGSGEGSNNGGKSLKQTKRAAQNREAQRAFRSRKEQYIKELEHTSTLYTALQATHSSLTSRLTSLESTLTMVESDRRRFEVERASHDAERCLWERERAAFAAERAAWAKERAEWASERREWDSERREGQRGLDGETRDSERAQARDALRRELDADAALLTTPEVEVEELVISPGVRAAQEAELARERKRARLD